MFSAAWKRALAFGGALPVVLAMAASPIAAAGVVQRIGAEFQANSIHDSWQNDPTVAALSDGGFAVAWTDFSGKPPDTTTSVRARCFSHAGAPRGADFVVPTTRTAVQREPSAARVNGGFVVLWTDDSHTAPDDSYGAVRGQRYTNACGKAGTELLVNKGRLYDQNNPAASSLPNGGFVAAFTDWSGLHGDTHSGGITGQNFQPGSLTRAGAEVGANSTTPWSQEYPSAAGLSSGNSAITWTDSSGADSDIRAQLIGPGGALIGAEQVVNRTTSSDQLSSAAASIGRGKYAVVWEDDSRTGQDQSGLAVRGQIMASSGRKLGPEFLIPTRRASDQKQPAVAGFQNGRFVVVWRDDSGDGFESGVRGQMYSAVGKRLGSEFLVNGRKKGAQETPAVATLDNRDFVVVWTDWSLLSPDKDGAGVRGQVFRVTQ